MNDHDVVLESELLDVTDIDLDRVNALPDSVLRASLHRILAERAAVPDQYTIFQNSL
jgi:FXSXX-COOH protein